jgi:hypothetical protein
VPDDTPLIWTTKGNLPIASLAYHHAWTETPDEISFVEEYKLDGEVVKRNVHIFLKKGLTAETAVGGVG